MNNINDIYDALYFQKLTQYTDKLRETYNNNPEKLTDEAATLGADPGDYMKLLNDLSIYHYVTELKAGDLATIIATAQEKIRAKATQPTATEEQILNLDFLPAAFEAIKMFTPEEIITILKEQYFITEVEPE